MREILLLLIVGSIALSGFLNPLIALYGYIWFALFRPEYAAFSAGHYNYSEWLAISLLLGSWRYLINIPTAWFSNPITRVLLLLQVPILISTFGALVPEFGQERYLMFIKMIIVTLWVPLLITRIEDLKKLYIVTAISLGTWGLWHGANGVLRGGIRIYSGIGGFMAENNTYACGLVMILPFCWYSYKLASAQWLRLLLLAMSFGTMATIVFTHSRSAAAALVVVVLLIALQSRQKVLTLSLIVLLGVGPVIFLVRKSYVDRLSSIGTYQEDRSAMERFSMMRVAYKVWKDHRYFGVGLGDYNFFLAASPYKESEVTLVVHNSYFQMLVHGGIFAFLIYIYLLVMVLWRMWRDARRMRRLRPELEPYPRAIQLSMIAFLIVSMAHPRAFFDVTYLIMMYAAAWYSIERRMPAPVPTVAQEIPMGTGMPAWQPRREAVTRT